MPDAPTTTIYLELTFSAGLTQRLPFATVDDANAQLELIEPKIGARFSNDPEKARHRILSGDGSIVVSINEILSARVIDQRMFRELTAWDNENIKAHTREMVEMSKTPAIAREEAEGGA